MPPELSIPESYDWLRSTLEHLASIPHLSEDDFNYAVFEVLDANAWSALSDLALNRLVAGDIISESARIEIRRLRSVFIALVDAEYAVTSLSPARIRRDDRWLDVAQSCEKILSKYIQRNAA